MSPETETQDVAVILLNKDKNKKISLQMVGDEELYGKDYIIEPKGNSSITPNPSGMPVRKSRYCECSAFNDYYRSG